ncbi:hypothetical protein ACIPPR_25000 [Streptomyces nigra]|uniref:hypothetical protein n=1 Tax=Streptomyces nigra TaxID=1827580 RepID=UPI00381BA9A0
MEPFTLAVLGSVVAAEGVRFLYGQATDVLKEWRERRAASRGDDAGDAVEVPLQESSALDHSTAVTTVDADLLGEVRGDLVALSAKLSPYALGHEDIDLEDRELAENVNSLRLLLEGLYGVRLTFKGESREKSGTTLDVRQKLDAVRGSAVGLEAGRISKGADVSVQQDVREIGEGGNVTGAKVDEIQ